MENQHMLDKSLIKPGWKHIALNRFPLKHIWDSLSLMQILLRGEPNYRRSLSSKQKLNCVKFYFSADGIRRLQVAPPRSGSRWGQLGLALALDLANGGDGEYTFENDIFYPRDGLICQRLDWRVPTGDMERMHYRMGKPFMGKQCYFVSHNAYFRIRSAMVKKMKIVVVTRSILAILESRYLKFANDPKKPEVTMDDHDSFDWDGSLTRVIEFFNSWGDVMRWHPNIRHYKFEDLKADPVGTHRDMLDFWGLHIAEDCIAEGFARASKKEMLKRMPPAQPARNIRVSIRGSEQRGIISDARKRHIIDRLSRELIFDFGHNLDDETEYKIAYG